MDSIDTYSVERRARIRYELGRARRAIVGVLPLAIVIIVATLVATRPSATLASGASVFALGAVFLWYGRDLKRAVLPGVGAGLVPLALATCAKHVGHVCTGDGCVMLCVPACTLGGIVAGLAVASVGLRRRSGVGFWIGASAVAVLTGVMGCACVGYAGVFGLAGGYAGAMVPGLLRARFARSRS